MFLLQPNCNSITGTNVAELQRIVTDLSGEVIQSESKRCLFSSLQIWVILKVSVHSTHNDLPWQLDLHKASLNAYMTLPALKAII